MIFKRRKNENSTYSYSEGGNKVYMSGTEHLTLNSKNETLVKEIRQDIEKLHKYFNNQADKILEYIENAGTNIYRFKHAGRLLSILNEEEGVIFERTGLSALILSLVTDRKPSIKTAPMFVLNEGNIDYLALLHNFYRWYSWTKGLPGFDSRAQWLFKRYMKYPNADLSKLKPDDIIKTQEAVARDKEATEFCLHLARETFGAKNVQKKINEEGGANI